jgi:penicillin-binding protein 2
LNPEIIVATLFENGREGPLAAPIVRDVIKAYFDKKARQKQANTPQNLSAAIGGPGPALVAPGLRSH